MSSASMCYSEINRYNIVKNYVNGIINDLNNANDYGCIAKSNIEEIYSVNNEITPVCVKLNSLNDDIIKTSNYLKNIIVPAINNKIKALYRLASEIEAAEAEAEAKAKAEAKVKADE